jgi:hypothetical protein
MGHRNHHWKTRSDLFATSRVGKTLKQHTFAYSEYNLVIYTIHTIPFNSKQQLSIQNVRFIFRLHANMNLVSSSVDMLVRFDWIMESQKDMHGVTHSLTHHFALSLPATFNANKGRSHKFTLICRLADNPQVAL